MSEKHSIPLTDDAETGRDVLDEILIDSREYDADEPRDDEAARATLSAAELAGDDDYPAEATQESAAARERLEGTDV